MSTLGAERWKPEEEASELGEVTPGRRDRKQLSLLWGVGGEVLEQEKCRVSRDKETYPPMSQDARFHQGDRLPQFTSPGNLLLLSLQQPLGSLVIKRCCLCLFP